MGGLLVLSLACRNPHLPIAGVISSSAFLGFPNEKPMDLGKQIAVKLIGDFMGVITNRIKSSNENKYIYEKILAANIVRYSDI